VLTRQLTPDNTARRHTFSIRKILDHSSGNGIQCKIYAQLSLSHTSASGWYDPRKFCRHYCQRGRQNTRSKRSTKISPPLLSKRASKHTFKNRTVEWLRAKTAPNWCRMRSALSFAPLFTHQRFVGVIVWCVYVVRMCGCGCVCRWLQIFASKWGVVSVCVRVRMYVYVCLCVPCRRPHVVVQVGIPT